MSTVVQWEREVPIEEFFSGPLEWAASTPISRPPSRRNGMLTEIPTEVSDSHHQSMIDPIPEVPRSESPAPSGLYQFDALATLPQPDIAPELEVSTPGFSSRYEAAALPKNRSPVVIPHMKRRFPSLLSSNSHFQWLRYDHPEGNIYHATVIEKRYGLRLVTEASPQHFPCIENQFLPYILHLLQGMLGSPGDDPFENCDIVVFPKENSSFAYYLADHVEGVLFWLHPFFGKNINIRHDDEIIPVDPQIALKYQYWHHVEMFPSHIPNCVMATAGRLTYLKAMVTAASTDHNTSGIGSVSPSCPEMLVRMRDDLDHVKESTTPSTGESYRNWIVARGYKMFGESQLTHGHGSEHARIDRSMRYRFTDDSKTKTYHLARAFCLVLLLNGQAGIHRRLRRTWGDGVISQPEWYALVQSLLEIWQQQTLLATIVLAAAIGLLAIPFPGSDDKAAQIFGYHGVYLFCSISCGLICIVALISGLMLQKLFGSKTQHFADTAANWLKSHYYRKLGLLPLAVLLSAPWLFLQTGLGFLVAALGSMAIDFHGLRSWAACVYAALAFVSADVLFLIKRVAGNHDEEGTQGNAILILCSRLKLRERLFTLGTQITAPIKAPIIVTVSSFWRFRRNTVEEEGHELGAQTSQAV